MRYRTQILFFQGYHNKINNVNKPVEFNLYDVHVEHAEIYFLPGYSRVEKAETAL